MISVSPRDKIFLYRPFIDFRKGLDSLICFCKYQLHQDPFSGVVFMFFNRRRTSLRILRYDGQGFWLCTKRLSKGFFKKDNLGRSCFLAEDLRPCDFLALIWNGDPGKINFPPDWRKIS